MAVGPPGGSGQTIAQVFTQKGLWAWFNSPVTQYFNGVTEKGQDYSTTFGTPVGVPVGGKIVRMVYMAGTAINWIVELQDSSGAVWLYQHILTSVKVGQVLQCGDIIGTEDGCVNDYRGGFCQTDQYSTGPHIEVRYCLPGTWSPGTGSWTEPWINPQSVFASIGSQQAGSTSPGGPIPPGGNPGGVFNGSLSLTFGGYSYMSGFINGVNKIVTPLAPSADVAQTLAAMDAYLYLINPFVFSNGEPTFTIGAPSIGVGPVHIGGEGATFPDPIAWAQDVAINMAEDANAFIIRLVLFCLGLSILIKVISAVIDFDAIGTAIKNGINPTGLDPKDVVSMAGAFL